ncbi:PEGA domain-containing protein [Myxococcota bacterium]
MKHYDAEEFRWALLEFRRAFEISQNYRVLYNIGRINEKLNQYADATRAFDQYLRLGGKDIGTQRRSEVQRDLAALRPKTARLRIRVPVDGAEVFVNNRRVGLTPLRGGVTVDAGEHFISVRHPQYAQEEKRLVVAAGDTVEERLALHPPREPWTALTVTDLEQARTRVSHSRVRQQESEPRGLDSTTQTIWITTGVLAVGASVTGGLALVNANKLAALRNSPGSTQEERTSARLNARGLALASDALISAAAFSGVTALYLTLWPKRVAPEVRAQTRIGVQGPQVALIHHY